MKSIYALTITGSLLLMACNSTPAAPQSPEGWTAELQVGTLNLNTIQNAGLPAAYFQSIVQSSAGHTVQPEAVSNNAFTAFLNFTVKGKPVVNDATLTFKGNNSTLKLLPGELWTSGVFSATGLKQGQKLQFELSHQSQTLKLEATFDASKQLPAPMVQSVKLETGKLDVKWSAVTGAKHYRVLIDQDDNPLNGQLLDSGVLTTTTWTTNINQTLNEGGTYYVTVLASNLDSRNKTQSYTPTPVPLVSAAAVKTTAQKPVVPGTLSFYTPSLNLQAKVNTKAVGTLTIQSGNAGLDATLTTVQSSTAVTQDSPAFTLAPNSTRTVNVSVQCPATPSNQSATLRLSTNDPKFPSVDLPISVECQPEGMVKNLWTKNLTERAEDGAWNPAGTRFALVSGTDVLLLDETFKNVGRVKPNANVLKKVNWLNDQTLVLTSNSKMLVWDVVANQATATWNIEIGDPLAQLATHPSKNWIALSGFSNTLAEHTHIYDLKGQTVKLLPGLTNTTFSPDGKTFAGWTYTRATDSQPATGQVVFYTTDSLEVLRKVNVEANPYNTVQLAWSRDGSQVQVVTSPSAKNSTLYSVNATSGEVKTTPLDFAVAALTLQTDLNGQVLLFSKDQQMVRWNPATGQSNRKTFFFDQGGTIPRVVAHPKLGQFALMSGGSLCQGTDNLLLDLNLNVLNTQGTWYCQGLNTMGFNASGDVMHYGNRQMHVFAGTTGQLNAYLNLGNLHPQGKVANSIHHNGKDTLAFQFSDGSVEALQWSTQKFTNILPADENALGLSIRLAPQGTFLMVQSSDGSSLKVFDTTTGQLKRERTAPMMLSFTGWLDQNRLVYWTEDKFMLLNVATGEEKLLENNSISQALKVANGQAVYVQEGYLFKLDPATAQRTALQLTYKLTQNAVPIRAHPTGNQKVVVVSLNPSTNRYTTSIFDLQNGEELQVIHQSQNQPLDIDSVVKEGKLYVAIHTEHENIKTFVIE
ncbi:WD40 repeat domain-containing protein [Deinococcus misasensis]|uniref:WD40 repeat domain-containing protein n=1 Tax=Deinococcus misasensis TaxID=392413 RepID=UPI0012F7E9C4|nr:hypothetical protein [Deinococcus misasensis]